jgi:ATP-dependent RNA helicase SUPV3L1/SUV3
LLTRRNDPAPAQTWGQDTAKVLSGPYEPGAARRLQNALKTLLR